MENPRTAPTLTRGRKRRPGERRPADGARLLATLTGAALIAGLAVAPAATGAPPVPTSAQAAGAPADADIAPASLPAMELYRAEAGVNVWLDENPDDPRAPLIAERIGSQPQAVWFAGEYDPDTITERVAEVTSAAEAAGQLPVVVPYMIPFRDCGNHSGGGAPSFAAYAEWGERFAAGLGSEPVVVVLEPDAIPLIDCLDDQQRAERLAALSGLAEAVTDANPSARVYYDVGHSGWHAPAEIAPTLVEAGVLEHGAGIATNISNYRTTADETAYAAAVVAQLGGGLGAVVDTSRNGNGPLGSEWCDPPGRLVGHTPTTNTGVPGVDAYLWIKLPGELDGCDGPAGSFSPAKAYELAGG
ncbi:glycoside hydrolase family 6 protein [Streptomyces lonarensis]|uniref:Glucanase n=1 Tax=Streptomyces lonarensis TaxID=700599 RepID=A0A7X6D016_9ACTN|nr:glycoside hydrolase family 6 protein [Streptomyces lonarensis]NJQ05662.1 glycoside hydrolase family 6 protein [Streptomyces lonarensis]